MHPLTKEHSPGTETVYDYQVDTLAQSRYDDFIEGGATRPVYEVGSSSHQQADPSPGSRDAGQGIC